MTVAAKRRSPTRVLVTGGRAPVALDIARRLRKSGHLVVMADSLQDALGFRSNAIDSAVLLPRPVDGIEAYIKRLNEVIAKHTIETVFPTCEEIFFLAKARDQLAAPVFGESFDALRRVHDKATFAHEFSGEEVRVPETIERTWHSIRKNGLPLDPPLVLKPVFSRFASRTILLRSWADCERLITSAGRLPHSPDEERWVAQRYIEGREWSTYSVARDGKLSAHVSYHSRFRAGAGSGICFEHVIHPQIESFVRSFVSQRRWHGQIGFDLIEDSAGKLWVIECNPRATSGLHLFSNHDPLADAWFGECQAEPVRPTTKRPVMVEFAMPIWGLKDAIGNRRFIWFLKSLLRSRCSTFAWKDPLPSIGLPFSLWRLWRIARHEGCSLQEASTRDIEWNGEDIR